LLVRDTPGITIKTGGYDLARDGTREGGASDVLCRIEEVSEGQASPRLKQGGKAKGPMQDAQTHENVRVFWKRAKKGTHLSDQKMSERAEKGFKLTLIPQRNWGAEEFRRKEKSGG